jgi:hypothetical protein
MFGASGHYLLHKINFNHAVLHGSTAIIKPPCFFNTRNVILNASRNDYKK